MLASLGIYLFLFNMFILFISTYYTETVRIFGKIVKYLAGWVISVLLIDH